jgi:Domain of unknown function (DUF5602)
MKKMSFITFLFVAPFASCKKSDDAPKIYNGESVQVADGSAHTFIKLDANNNPLSIGIRLTADALNDLPAAGDSANGGEFSYMLSLPQQAATSGFDHCELDWNPNGHEPLFAYGVPHFDFHFYLITPEEQAAVIPGPDTVPVDLQYIPQDYVSGVMAVPDMGTHWSDTTAPEFNGQPFTATFIYGFYHGAMTFLEPMITQAFLETKTDFTLQIKQPQAFQKHGYYPKQMHEYFDSQTGEYVIELTELTYQ